VSSDVSQFLDRFVSTVSHELRTPLSVVVGYAELLEARDDPATRREAVLRIREAAERLASVIDAILLTATIDSGTVVLDPVPVDLVETVEETIRGHGERHFELAAGAWPVVSADPEQLREILRQLVSNACKYSPPEAPVTIDAVRRDGFAVISVADRGRGIPTAQRELLFERFARGDGAAATGGSGLGLYIVRGLVELHGGSVAVESETGVGTTVSFTVPLADPTSVP